MCQELSHFDRWRRELARSGIGSKEWIVPGKLTRCRRKSRNCPALAPTSKTVSIEYLRKTAFKCSSKGNCSRRQIGITSYPSRRLRRAKLVATIFSIRMARRLAIRSGQSAETIFDFAKDERLWA